MTNRFAALVIAFEVSTFVWTAAFHVAVGGQGAL